MNCRTCPAVAGPARLAVPERKRGRAEARPRRSCDRVGCRYGFTASMAACVTPQAPPFCWMCEVCVAVPWQAPQVAVYFVVRRLSAPSTVLAPTDVLVPLAAAAGWRYVLSLWQARQ